MPDPVAGNSIAKLIASKGTRINFENDRNGETIFFRQVPENKKQENLFSDITDFEKQFPVEPAGGFTHIANWDRQLAHGVIPKELKLGVRTFGLSGTEQVIDSGDISVGENRTAYIERAAITTFCSMMIWGAVGMFVSCYIRDLYPLTGAFIGAGAGVLKDLLGFFRSKKGDATVSVDGKAAPKKFYINPKDYVKTPEELRVLLNAAGVLGDDIQPLQPKKLPKPNPVIARKMEESKDLLTKLGRERRLVASLGNKSRYGYTALDMIDAVSAKNFIAAGMPVYVVNGKETMDIPHSYSVTARSRDKESIENIEDYMYTERRFNYDLTKITKPEDLSTVQDGTGIPNGLFGVYKDLTSYTGLIRAQEEHILREDTKNWKIYEHHKGQLKKE